MFSIAEQFSAAIKAHVDAQLATTTALASKAIENAGKFSSLNMNFARFSLEESSVATRQMMSAKDPQEFLSLVATHVQPTVEKALAYGRQMVSVASISHCEFATAMEVHFTEMSHQVTLAVDESWRHRQTIFGGAV